MIISNKKKRKQRKSPDLKIARIFLLLLALWAVAIYFSSCKSTKPAVQKSSDTVEKTIEKDKLTPIGIPGETANLKAIFECDSLNRVLLKNYNELKSKNMNSTFSFADGKLDYRAKTEPDTVFIPSTDHWYYVNRNITNKFTITKTIYTTVKVNKWGFLDWIGLVVLIAGIAFVVYKTLTKTAVLNWAQKFLKSIKK